MNKSAIELTILMPCLDEAETLQTCIERAKVFIEKNNLSAEVLIADNGSKDSSVDIATSCGARVVHVSEKGYGNALIAGIRTARGKYVIMGDADDSYDFLSLEPFLERLRQGYDLVMGNRFKGGIAKNAMPPLHRYLGNPVLSLIGKLFFKVKIGDFHCGLRGFNRERMQKLNLVCGGMEFASEMVVKSSLNEYSIDEVPTTLTKDGRSRPPHLRSWQDGWRHLRFLLVFGPQWLFLYPGLLLMFIGIPAMVLLIQGPLTVGNKTFDIHTLMFAAAAVVAGVQLIGFFVLGRRMGEREGLLPDSLLLGKFRSYISLEKMLVLGLCVFLVGMIYAIYSIQIWQQIEFGELDPRETMRKVIPSVTFVISGVQIFFTAFFAGLIESFSTSKRTP